MITWVFLSGTLEPMSLLVGFGVSLLTARLTGRIFFAGDPPRSWGPWSTSLRRAGAAMLYLPIFLFHMIQATLDVARQVVSPRNQIAPAIIKYSTCLQSRLEVMLLANLITLTPGTMTIDYDPNRNELYIHYLTLSMEDSHSQLYMKEIQSMERWVKRILR